MVGKIKSIIRKALKLKVSPEKAFLSDYYQLHNQKRLEHLASLGLDISDSTVLEVGAGIGDHTGFFLDRDCQVVSTDARPENLEILRNRYPDLEVRLFDLDCLDTATLNETFDVKGGKKPRRG
ncbi:MAG: class I SAM-dependent methyltransferase [Phycisphaerae bacterium]|nr:class I SAM-dependent methyltransferase [Phycisphaerae bacterium]